MKPVPDKILKSPIWPCFERLFEKDFYLTVFVSCDKSFL